MEFNFVGASASKLLKNAIWATVVAVIVMLIYIIIRFTLSSGLSAVICLMHDVLIMIALTTIFRIQINTKTMDTMPICSIICDNFSFCTLVYASQQKSSFKTVTGFDGF